jgi:hypothetical protein
MALAVRQSTATDLSAGATNGDYEPLQVDANGRLWGVVNIDQMNGVAVTMGNGVSGTGVQRVTLASDSTGQVALATGSNTIGALTANQSVNVAQINGVTTLMGNGASGTGAQRVTIANDSTGILAGVTTVTTVTTCSTLTTLTGGGVAHDGVDSGNPVKIGVKATASVLGGTPVSAADRTDLFAGTDGVLIVRESASLEDIISDQKTNTDGASTAMTGAFAATASQRIYLTDLCICNSSATACTVDIRDGSAGSVLFTAPVPANGGFVHAFKVPLRFTANTALAFDPSAATSTISVSCVGFKSKA